MAECTARLEALLFSAFYVFSFIRLFINVKLRYVKPCYSRQDLLNIGLQCNQAVFVPSSNILVELARTAGSLWIVGGDTGSKSVGAGLAY